MMMEAARASEMLANLRQPTRRYNLEDSHKMTNDKVMTPAYLTLTSLPVLSSKNF
jgi:hypothetical protein